jgi:hypothetical protein
MWETLYKTESISKLAERFKCGVNTVRSRLEKAQIAAKPRGGANNQKVTIDKQLIDDVISLGVRKAAEMRSIKPQTLYQRLYYKSGLSVKLLKEAAEKSRQEELKAEKAKPSPSSPECEDVLPTTVLPPAHEDK